MCPAVEMVICVDYSCAHDSSNLTSGLVNPLRTYIRASTVIESSRKICKDTHS